MGFFDFLKKKAAPKNEQNKPTPAQSGAKLSIAFTETVNGKTSQMTVPQTEITFPTNFDHLTAEGDLPFGWITRNKDFTEKINAEYSIYLNYWLESRNKAPLEHYAALKSFVMFLDDAERMCKAQGECFEFWFYNVLSSKEYIEKRRRELNELTGNFDEESANYNKRENALPGLDKEIVKALKENPGILQSDFVKLFDPTVQADVRDKLYYMEKSGKLQRTKSGRSYILHYKK